MIYIVVGYAIYALIGALLAIVAESVYKAERVDHKTTIAFVGKFFYRNMTFPFILFAEDRETIRHEWGHEIQMLILLVIEIAVVHIIDFSTTTGIIINTVLFYPVFALINYIIATWVRAIFKIPVERYWFETTADKLGKL